MTKAERKLVLSLLRHEEKRMEASASLSEMWADACVTKMRMLATAKKSREKAAAYRAGVKAIKGACQRRGEVGDG